MLALVIVTVVTITTTFAIAITGTSAITVTIAPTACHNNVSGISITTSIAAFSMVLLIAFMLICFWFGISY